MNALWPCTQFTSGSTDQETLTAQVPSLFTIKKEPSSVVDLQSRQSDWKHECIVKQELHSQNLSCSIKHEHVPGQQPHDIKPEHTAHITKSKWIQENVVKLEYHSQDAVCFDTQTPGEELCHIQAEHAAHNQQTGGRHDSDVKTEVNSEEAICSVKTEVYLTGRQPESESAIEEYVHEMSDGGCKAPEMMDIVLESHQCRIQDTLTVQVPCLINIKSEPSSVVDHQSRQSDWKHECVVKQEFHSQNPSCSIKTEVSGQQLHDIKPEHAAHSPKSEWIQERVVKLEHSQGAICCGTQTPVQFSSGRLKHMVTHGVDGDIKICKSVLKRSSGLKVHMVIHIDEKPYKCSVCKATFTCSNGLKQHMVTHSDEKPYQCSECKATFKRAGGLKNHMMTHSDEKPYQCSKCKAKFKCSKYLKVHMVTHSDERPYRCSECKATFKCSKGLKLHMVTHSDERM